MPDPATPAQQVRATPSHDRWALLLVAAMVTACTAASGCAGVREAAGRVETPPECSMSEAFPAGFPHRPPAVTGGENHFDTVLTWHAAVPLEVALDHYRDAVGAEPFDGPDGPTFEAEVEGTDVVIVVSRVGLDDVTVRVFRP